MSGASFERLRELNTRRVALCGRALELAGAMSGEPGEAADFAEKIGRLADRCNVNTGGADRSAMVKHLGKELADIVIFADLLAASEGINLGQAVAEKFDEVSARVNFPERFSETF